MKTQILYPKDILETEFSRYFIKEATMMKNKGFYVGTEILPKISKYIYRGYTHSVPMVYNKFSNLPWINNLDNFFKTLNMDKFFPIIKEWSFPTEIIQELDRNKLEKIRNDFNCERLFIKDNVNSLHTENSSIYPDNYDLIVSNFKKYNLYGPYIIRKYIDNKEIFYNEQRVWVLNGNVYLTAPSMPDFVFEAAKRMYEFSGSKYFVLDVAGDYIVEVNPGESSDRGGFNSLEWFCDIFSKEFLK